MKSTLTAWDSPDLAPTFVALNSERVGIKSDSVVAEKQPPIHKFNRNDFNAE
jgi:hypothetical protein